MTLCFVLINVDFVFLLQVSVDTLSWDFMVSSGDDDSLLAAAKVTHVLSLCPASLLNTCLFSGLTLFVGRGLDRRAVPGGGWLGQQELVSGGSGAHADGLYHAGHPLQTCGAKEDEQE